MQAIGRQPQRAPDGTPCPLRAPPPGTNDDLTCVIDTVSFAFGTAQRWQPGGHVTRPCRAGRDGQHCTKRGASPSLTMIGACSPKTQVQSQTAPLCIPLLDEFNPINYQREKQHTPLERGSPSDECSHGGREPTALGLWPGARRRAQVLLLASLTRRIASAALTITMF